MRSGFPMVPSGAPAAAAVGSGVDASVLSDATWRVNPLRSITSSVVDLVGSLDGSGGPGVQPQAAGGIVVGGDVTVDGDFSTPNLGDLTGGIDIRWRGRVMDPAGATGTYREILTQMHGPVLDGVWDNFELAWEYASGAWRLFFEWTEIDGTIEAHNAYTQPGDPVPPAWADATLRFTLDFDNGGNYRVDFWRLVSGTGVAAGDDTTEDGKKWARIRGFDGIGTTSIDTGVTTDWQIGSGGPGQAVIEWLEVYNGVDGTLLASPNVGDATDSRTLVDAQANTWTATNAYVGSLDRACWVYRSTTIPDGVGIEPAAGSFTFAGEVLVQTFNASDPVVLLSKGIVVPPGSGNPGFGLVDLSVVFAANVIGWVFNEDGDNPLPLDLTPHAWHHLVLVVDRDADLAHAWVDGEWQASLDISAVGTFANSEDLLFGDTADSVDAGKAGGVWGRMAFWDRALTPAEIAALDDEWAAEITPA